MQISQIKRGSEVIHCLSTQVNSDDANEEGWSPPWAQCKLKATPWGKEDVIWLYSTLVKEHLKSMGISMELQKPSCYNTELLWHLIKKYQSSIAIMNISQNATMTDL